MSDTSYEEAGGRQFLHHLPGHYRLEGHTSIATLLPAQQLKADFKLKICKAMETQRQILRHKKGKPGFNLRLRDLQNPVFRSAIRDEVQRHHKGHVETTKIEGSQNLCLPGARTMYEMLKAYDAHGDDSKRLLALVPADYLRGNRVPRLGWDVRRMMKSVIDEFCLDRRNPGFTNAHKKLGDEIVILNAMRKANELPALQAPSLASLRDFFHEIVTPIQHLIGTTGQRHAKNARSSGRGGPAFSTRMQPS